MIEHYRRGRFDHPVFNLSSEATMSLFDEMDAVADDLRRDPWCVEADLQIAFRQLQKRRRPDLTEAQFLELCPNGAITIARDGRLRRPRRAPAWRTFGASATPCSERAASQPDARGRIDARLREMASEIAAAFEARGGRAVIYPNAAFGSR